MPNQLPSGRWRARVFHPKTRRQIPAHTVIGGPKTFEHEWQAHAAEHEALAMLVKKQRIGVTVQDWWDEWTTDPLWQRPAESTNTHNKERTSAFVRAYRTRALVSIGAEDVANWLKGGKNNGTVPALRAMFNDARSTEAGCLVSHNPFEKLGLKRSKGRKDKQPPTEELVWKMLDAARRLTPPSFVAYLTTACWSAARPGELDYLQKDYLDFTPGAESIRIEWQWNAKTRKPTPPKHDVLRTVAMTEPVLQVLQDLPPGRSNFAFETIRGTHYTPSSRSHHWNRVRADVGIGNTELYLATRHFFGWYALNVLRLEPHVIAQQFGHTDGGELIQQLYGHPDADIARDRIRDSFRQVAWPTSSHHLRAA